MCLIATKIIYYFSFIILLNLCDLSNTEIHSGSSSSGSGGSGGSSSSSNSNSNSGGSVMPTGRFNTPNDGQIRYDAPDDCKFFILPTNDVQLICHLRTVNSEFDTTNFSVIPSEHTTSLSILCSNDIMTRSSLESKSFIHLLKLKELSLEYCKFTKFHKDILYGLSDLKNFTIKTHNINWPALSLEIESDSFRYSKNLERLDLSQNNIWSLPESLFCSLNGLSFLNISKNRLQDINDLGFREKQQQTTTNSKDETNNHSSTSTTSTTTTTTTTTISTTATESSSSSKQNHPKNVCFLDLETLDISHNHFVLLPSNGFGTLKRLKHLIIHDNEISMLADKALAGLKNLQILNLSSNKIVALPSELFKDPVQSIQEVYLQNNSISVLSPGLFANLEQLQTLDLSTNQLTSSWINRNTFSGLIRLVLLNLSNNKITKLEPEIFTDLYTLQILNLRLNQLESIGADTFSPMNNLHTLLLSHNKIKYLDAYSLNGLYVLSLLSLDNNVLSGVHPEAFRNCSSLQDLNLNGNKLTAVPLALKDMRLLRTVDLGENIINKLEEPGFRGMTNLYGLRLIDNNLEHISNNTFKDLPSLQILNLARNKIRHIEVNAFVTSNTIQAIRLDGNFVRNIDGLFTNMQNLLWLNMSDNKLDYFDFSQIPYGLQWLDLHKNDLVELSNTKGLDNQLKLQTLDASFNRLQKVTSASVPNSIELLFLNDNLITSIEYHTFKHKHNLTRVDLYANQITSLDIKSLRLDPITDDKFLPEFYIGGNPFICDCNIDWLQKINQVTSRQYPRIMDLETIYCKLLYNRDRAYIPLIEAEPVHFLCTYKTHCFALCQCCEFDACDCEMTCPNNCTCFHDQSWSTNVVECSGAGYTDMPANIPMDTTEVYIDGNNLGEISGHSFIGRKNLKVLYANNSNIHVIYNTTFSGLKRLTILHLESNKIERFIGNEFGSLENLRELYLQNNRINHIDNRTFIELRKLEVLRLDGNKLTHFEVWQLTMNPYLVEVGLADNMWSCECSYLNKLRTYLQTNSEKIYDGNKIACVYNNLSNFLKEAKNGTKCTLKDGISTIVRSSEIEDLLPLLLAATCAFVGFFGLIFGLFCYRRELKLWAHTHCFSNMCYKTANFIDEYDKDRLYDAYVTYSLQDEHFVNQILATTLENDVGYRLSLHYRDFNVNTYVTDTIIEAVESSKRSIIVLSKNFLYNEWSRFEYKSAIHELIKRRKKIIFVLYGDLPQRDIDANMRLYLRTNTCIEWDDKKFWQKLRIVLPHVRKNHCLTKRSAINIYATAHDYNAGTTGRGGGGVGGVGGGGVGVVGSGLGGLSVGSGRLDCGNYATINNCTNRNCDKFEQVNNCKYNTNSRRLNDFSTTTNNKFEHRQHEYAVPTNCVNNIGQQKFINSESCEKINDHLDCTQSDCSHSSLSHSSHDCVVGELNFGGVGLISGGGGGGVASGGGVGGDRCVRDVMNELNLDSVGGITKNCFSYNCRNNCSTNNCVDQSGVINNGGIGGMVVSDEHHHCNKKSDNTKSTATTTVKPTNNYHTLGIGEQRHCIDRRLPQAMWA